MRVKQLIAREGERSFAVVLDSGDEVTAQLMSFAKAHHVKTATFTAIGALSSVTLGFFDFERKTYNPIDLKEQVELVSLIGNVTEDGGDVRLHCHAVVANSRGQAFGGHLLKAIVHPTLEAIVTDTPAHLARRHDPDSGLALLAP